MCRAPNGIRRGCCVGEIDLLCEGNFVGVQRRASMATDVTSRYPYWRLPCPCPFRRAQHRSISAKGSSCVFFSSDHSHTQNVKFEHLWRLGLWQDSEAHVCPDDDAAVAVFFFYCRELIDRAHVGVVTRQEVGRLPDRVVFVARRAPLLPTAVTVIVGTLPVVFKVGEDIFRWLLHADRKHVAHILARVGGC